MQAVDEIRHIYAEQRNLLRKAAKINGWTVVSASDVTSLRRITITMRNARERETKQLKIESWSGSGETSQCTEGEQKQCRPYCPLHLRCVQGPTREYIPAWRIKTAAKETNTEMFHALRRRRSGTSFSDKHQDNRKLVEDNILTLTSSWTSGVRLS